MLYPSKAINESIEFHYIKYRVTTRVIYLTVVFLFFLALFSLPFIEIDVTSQARGIVKNSFENMPLQSVVNAQVLEKNISENLKVSKGDTLVVFNSSKIEEQIKRLEERVKENLTFTVDIEKLLKGKNEIVTSRFRQEKKHYGSRLAKLSNSLLFVKRELLVSKSLFDKGVISKKEYLKAKNDYDIALGEVNIEKYQFNLNLESKKTEFKIENKELKSQISQLKKEINNYVIIAPISGHIIQNTGVGVGSFVNIGQTIASISNNDKLIVECIVDPIDIGFVKKNQKIKFQFDAYDYNHWGVLDGSVVGLPSDIQLIQGNMAFPVRCSLSEKKLKLNNGFVAPIQKGMTVTGCFFLTKRSLWQLLFDKIDDWINPKIISD